MYKLLDTYKNFQTKLSELEKVAVEIIENENFSETKLSNFSSQWENEVIKCISSNIQPAPESLIDDFKYSFLDSGEELILKYDINKKRSHPRSLIWKKLNKKLDNFRLMVDYFSIVDSWRNKKVTLNSTHDKLDYILEKLHYLFNGRFHSLRLILEINNIKCTDSETIDISKNLYERGYILKKDQFFYDDLVKISTKGALYIERKKRASKKKQNVNDSELNIILNQIINKLEVLGDGQEIIFEELEELRDCIGLINKKNWIQLLKGKLLDLAISEIINKETASFIFESITNVELNFLK